MGLYSLSFLGMSSVGSLMAGALAGWIGAPAAVILGVSICVVVGLCLLAQGGVTDDPLPS